MRWLKHTLSTFLLIAAVAVAIATALSEHSDDYGAVALPQGGAVELPAKTVTVFYEEPGTGANSIHEPRGLGAFRVTPAGGGEPLPIRATGSDASESEVTVQRSETIGELGAVAKIDVPEEGFYVVTGRLTQPGATSSLTFGTSAGAAVIDRWRLLAGLVGGAFLLTLIPVPKPGRRWPEENAPVGWSDDPRAPYAG